MTRRRPPRKTRRAGPVGPAAANPAVQQVLFLLDTAYDRLSWHGPNLRGALRGVTPAQAAWRPAPGRHNIWELVVHAAYWKYVVWRRLTGAKRGSFPASGSNWIVRPEAGRDLKADVTLLQQTHDTLRDAVARLTDGELDAPAGHTTRRGLITGVAAHDLYHAGQIQLLKRLL